MATDLDVTTATWGTENTEPESDTISNAAYRTQVTRNTGFNYYTPKLIQQDHRAPYVNDGAVGTEVLLSVYSVAGPYAIYGRVYVAFVTDGGTAKVHFDGTEIFELATADAVAGSSYTYVGTVNPSRGWVTPIYTLLTEGAGVGTMGSSRLFAAGL